MSDPRVETVAEEFHRVYLLTAARLGWPIRPGVNAVYGHLAEDAKELDRALAGWHLLKMDAAEKRAEEAEAGWAAAREALTLFHDADELAAAGKDGESFQAAKQARMALWRFMDRPLPAQVERVRAMEKVVEAGRIYLRSEDEDDPKGHTDPDWSPIQLALKNFVAALSTLDAIEKR